MIQKRNIAFQNMFLNLKLKNINKSAIAQVEKKPGKLTCESISSKNSNMKKQKLNQVKRVKCIISTTINLKLVAVCNKLKSLISVVGMQYSLKESLVSHLNLCTKEQTVYWYP